MPIPEITLKEIENIADEKDEIYRGYQLSIDDVYTLYSVYINQNKVAVCNIMKAENEYEIVDFIGSQSVIKFIEKKIKNWQ